MDDLKLFIWTNFCRDYTAGLAFAVARDEAQARKLVRKKYGGEPCDWGDLEIRSLKKCCARYVCGGG